jgi:hypothetical protein
MKHLCEEELVEYYYSKNNAEVKRHLEACAECAQAFAVLQSDLAKMESAVPPARDASYGERVWASISGSLPQYEARKPGWRRIGLWRGLSYASACVLLIACVFYASRMWEHRQFNAGTQTPPAGKQRVVIVVLGDHLDRSERLLVELKHADADSAEMVSPLRDEARSLLASNQVCRQQVKQQDDPALATTLDRLDHLLSELANQQGELNAAALTRLQHEMQSDNLLFEVRVLRSRVPDQQAAMNNRSNGGLI